MQALLACLLFALAQHSATPARPAAPASGPATRPVALASEPFKVTQEVRARRGEDGEWQPQTPVEFWFADRHVLMVDAEGSVAGVYRLDEPAFLDGESRAVSMAAGMRWAETQRASDRWKRLAQDEQQGAFVRAMLHPQLEIANAAGGALRLSNEAIECQIQPMPAGDNRPKGSAASYAQAYRLSSIETAMLQNQPIFVFGPLKIADAMAERDLMPRVFTMTISGPAGTETFELQLRTGPLTDDERAAVQEQARQLATAPAAGEDVAPPSGNP